MDKKKLMNRVEEYIRAHQTEILEDLKTLVRFPSVSREGADGFPFGKNCANVLDRALAMAQEKGFQVNNHDYWYGTAFLGSEKNDSGLIGIFSHLDVVEAGNGWIYDPFEPTEKNGFLIGRGAGDNKSGAVIGMYTMKALKDLDIPLKSSVMLFFGCNEEAGMKDAEKFAKEHLMPDYSMVPDLFFPVCHGENGNLKFCIQPKTGFLSQLCIEAGDAENRIPGEAKAWLPYQEQLFAELRKEAAEHPEIQLSHEDNRILIKAIGKGGHSAIPKGTVNAIFLLMGFLKKIRALPEKDREVVKAFEYMMSDTQGIALGIEWADEPSGELVCTAVKARMEGNILKLLFSVRYPVTDFRERIENALEAGVDSKIFDIKIVSNNEPMYIPQEDPYVQTLMQIYTEVTGNTEKKPYVIDGGTYARKLKNAVGYGGGNGVRADFLPAGHGAVHQPDEARNIQGIFDAIKIYVMSVIAIDQYIQK